MIFLIAVVLSFSLEKTLPIGPRSFTSPASVMQPFKTQLNGQNNANPYGKFIVKKKRFELIIFVCSIY